MKELKTKQAPIITITSIGENTISKLTDCRLEISTKEKIHSKSAPYIANEVYSLYIRFNLFMHSSKRI